MKKSLLALAVLGAITGVAHAQSAVQVYGIIDAGISKKTDTTLAIGKRDNNRIGFKGTEDLGGGLKALFQLEIRFEPDTGTTEAEKTKLSVATDLMKDVEPLREQIATLALAGKKDEALRTMVEEYQPKSNQLRDALEDLVNLQTKLNDDDVNDADEGNVEPEPLELLQRGTSACRGFLAANLSAGHVNVALCDRQQARGAQARCEEAKVGTLPQQFGEPIGRRPDIQGDRLPRSDQLRGCERQASLDLVIAPQAGIERGLVAIDRRRRGPVWCHGAAVGADQRSVASELIEVAPDGHFRNAELCCDIGHDQHTALACGVDQERLPHLGRLPWASGASGGHVCSFKTIPTRVYRKRSLFAHRSCKIGNYRT